MSILYSHIKLGELSTLLTFIATMVGAIAISRQLFAAKAITKAEMLINLDTFYHNNEKLMTLYDNLEDENRNHAGATNFSTLNRADYAAFLDFFEKLSFLIENHIAEVRDIDPLFEYRFFSFIHCPYIQEEHLLPTSSSYSSIFRLYQKWIKYRTDRPERGTIMRVEHRLSETYLNEKLYLIDPPLNRRLIKTVDTSQGPLTMSTAIPADITRILDLQRSAIPDSTTPQDYYALTRDELIESIHLDDCILIEDANKLVAFCILILPRNSDRNLAQHFEHIKPEATLTFDIVFVDPTYRRLGIHSELIQQAMHRAKEVGAAHVVACTSPTNTTSLQRFITAGFANVREAEIFNGVNRCLLKFDLPPFACPLSTAK